MNIESKRQELSMCNCLKVKDRNYEGGLKSFRPQPEVGSTRQ